VQDIAIVPVHLGLILDGNRRWARERGLPQLEGHAEGERVLHDIVYHAVERGVKYVSAYAFSTENWSRSKKEVDYLMAQITKALARYADELIENGIRTVILGSRERLPKKAIKSIEDIERRTAHGQRATFAVCLNYGGQLEVAYAVRTIIEKGISPDEITPECIAEHLYHPDIPPIDLVIRTSGEQRLSNFMLWRAAYSELIFRNEYWPDFSVDSLDECLVEYSKRQRRFGG
jgi:undecaprenyl diphosphate synthase